MRFFDFKTRRSFDLGATTRLPFSTLRAPPNGKAVVYDTLIEADGSMLALQLRVRAK